MRRRSPSRRATPNFSSSISLSGTFSPSSHPHPPTVHTAAAPSLLLLPTPSCSSRSSEARTPRSAATAAFSSPARSPPGPARISNGKSCRSSKHQTIQNLAVPARRQQRSDRWRGLSRQLRGSSERSIPTEGGLASSPLPKISVRPAPLPFCFPRQPPVGPSASALSQRLISTREMAPVRSESRCSFSSLPTGCRKPLRKAQRQARPRSRGSF